VSRYLCIVTLFAIVGCSNEIYLKDGVTDGDTFSLAFNALQDDDPALQSWVTYSLIKSTCQLEIGGDNPARNSAYGCEFAARMRLLETWEEKLAADPAIENDYLDRLLSVRNAGFLDEYTVHYFADAGWQVPAEVDVAAFRDWRRLHLRRHRPQTRLVGFWTYQNQRRR